MAPLKKDLKTGKWYFVKEKKRRRKRKPRKRIGGSLITFIAILALLVLIIIKANSIAAFITEQIIIYNIEKRLTVQLRIDKVEADIYQDTVHLEGFRMISSNQISEKPFLYCPEGEGRFYFRQLFKMKTVMDDMLFKEPVLFIERNGEGKWNLPKRKKYRKPRWFFIMLKAKVEDGRIVFKDGMITEEGLTTELKEIRGEATNLSGRIPAGIEYNLMGYLNDTPLEAKGTIDSFKEPFDFSLLLKVRNLDLLPFASYQREITSCKLMRGKMDLEAELECEKNELDCMNKVVFKGLELQPVLGAKPSLIKVMGMGPATLATVLRDNEGRIRLNIPVKGDITDPDFKVGPALLKALIRAIQETIIGPFSSAAKLVFTKEGMSKIHLLPIEFVKGSARLAKGAITKLVDLSRLLIKYPATPLHIEGYVDPLSEKGLWKGTSLAQRRAKKIADYLIKEAKIPEEKIKLSAKEEKEKKRVELRIEE